MQPFPIPRKNVRVVSGWEIPKTTFDGRTDAGKDEYDKNKPLILNYLKTLDCYTTVYTLGQATKLNLSSVRRALRQLKSKDLVESTRCHIEGFKKGTMLWKLKGKEE